MDHSLTLLALIEEALSAGVPLAGGWLATRIETPEYPFGTIDMTSSTPMRGQRFGHGLSIFTPRGIVIRPDQHIPPLEGRPVGFINRRLGPVHGGSGADLPIN